MANLTFNSVEEFKDAMYRACQANDWWDPQEVFQELAARWATIKWFPIQWEDEFDFKPEDMKIILAWWEPMEWVNKRDPVEWEAWYDEWKRTHDKDLMDKTSFQDLTKEKWWWSKTWQEKLKIFADKYNKLLNETKDYVLDNYSGEWLTWEGREEFLKGLYKKQAALKELENSNEFKNLMLDLAEAWTWNPLDNWSLNWELNETLKLAASWAWSEMFQDKETLNNIVNAAKTSWIWKSLDSYIKNWWRASLIGPWAWAIWWLYNMFAWEDAQDIAKKYVSQNNLTRESLASKGSKKFDESVNKLTDAMKFWEDVAWVGWQDYLKARDEKLALALKLKWIESPEDIDKFLNKYDSWKNAKDEWKKNTLSNLSDKVSQITDEEIKEKVKAAKAKKSEKKEEKKEEKVWDNWTPSNDDSINWVEEDSSFIKDAIDIASWKKKLTKDDIYWILPDKVKQLAEWLDKETKTRMKNKETMLKNKDWIWKTDEKWYRDPDSPINEVEETNEKWGKGKVVEHEEQNPSNNKYLYIDETIKNIESDKERAKYLKDHWFKVNSKWYFEKNWMKTKVYKDGQYNPKYVKPDKKEWYNERTKVESPKQDPIQIALQETGYKWPRDSKWNFLPMTDEYLDSVKSKKNLKGKDKK